MNLFLKLKTLIYSDHPLVLLSHDILSSLSFVWNYILFRADNQPIAVSNVIISLILFSIGLRFARSFSILVRNKLSHNIKLDNHAASSLERISYYLFILIMVFFVLEVSNVPLTTLTVIGTTIALGIGLGSQNIANNFISGLIIMVEKPIKLGDIIEVKNIIGKVIRIGGRCVSLQTENNINMLIPNSNILQDNIINWTLNDPTLKLSLTLYIENNCLISEVDELLTKIISSNDNILKRPAPRILLQEISEDCLVFEMEFWIDLDNEVDRKEIFNNINRTIEPLFREHHIKIINKPDGKSPKKK